MLKNVVAILIILLISSFVFADEILPEVTVPDFAATLTEDGDLIIFPITTMLLKIGDEEYDVEIQPIKIKNFYTVKKPNFFVIWILPPLVCAGAGLIGTAIAKGDAAWQYTVSGLVGFGLGFIISAVINRGYR